MVRKQSIIGCVLICMLILIASCNSRSVGELPHNEISQQYVSLTDGTVDEIVELDSWKIFERSDPISLVRQNLALNRLTAVSEQTKKATQFSINEEETIVHQMIDIPDLRVFDIDEGGDQLLVGRSGQRLNELGELQEFFHWIALWDIPSGFLDHCFTEPCSGELTDPDQISYAYIGAVIDEKTEVTYSEGSYLTTGLSQEDGGGISLVNSPDVDPADWWHIGRIAVNSDQNRLAIVFQEGPIHLENISEAGNWPLAWTDVLKKGKENQLQPITEAIFDPDGRWLAIVRGQDLNIWRVRGWQREIFREQVGNVRGMQFNPSGELLFLGTDNAIRVISLKERKIIFDAQAPGITSLDISDDNRLLFWGDEQGTIHMWGIPGRK